ncbi:MAG: hypothetical protein ACYDHH_34495 [Solirubrobacteraceae bacterium]
MAAVAVHTTKPSVIVEGDAVLIDAFHEQDPQFIALVREAESPEQITHDCLSVGARALRGVEATIDAAIVDKRFSEFESKLERGTNDAVRVINETSNAYLDPDNGALRKMLDRLKIELDKSLDATFDPKSKESVLAKFEAVFASGTQDLGKVIRELVDPGNPQSPLGRLRTEMGGELREVRKALDELGKQVAIDKAAAEATAEVLELSAVKGRRFEEIVFEAVSEFVALYQDEPEAVGTMTGANGNQIGDILVTLNDADARNGQARYIVEAKDKKLGLKQALDELEHAVENRGAMAGVIVFANQEKAPIAVPCRAYGNKVVVVLDKEEMDPQPLRLALMTARLAVQRELYGPSGELDLEGALQLVEEGQRTLACHATIKRYHSAARNQIDNAATHTAELVRRVESILAALGDTLCGNPR